MGSANVRMPVPQLWSATRSRGGLRYTAKLSSSYLSPPSVYSPASASTPPQGTLLLPLVSSSGHLYLKCINLSCKRCSTRVPYGPYIPWGTFICLDISTLFVPFLPLSRDRYKSVNPIFSSLVYTLGFVFNRRLPRCIEFGQVCTSVDCGNSTHSFDEISLRQF